MSRDGNNDRAMQLLGQSLIESRVGGWCAPSDENNIMIM
jgi:hypothetical protein